MIERRNPDCIVIGYNESPFEQYEKLLRNYGEDSEAYRDLKFSFVDVSSRKLNYVGLLNHVLDLAAGQKKANRKHPIESGDIPNLAAVYLTNYLRRRGCTAAFINLFQQEKEQLANYLAQNPLLVAITTTFYVLNFPINEMVEFIRAYNSAVKIVVGGPLITNHLRNYQGDKLSAALDDIGADIYVTDSQGELTLTQIVECLRNGGDLKSVPNLIYAEAGKLQRTKVVPENNSLDENYIDWRDFPDYDLGSTLQTRTARSCAFKCSFCNYPGRAGALTLAGLATLEKEFDSMRELGARNVVFIDDTFNVPLPRFKDICRLMIKKDYQFNWFSYFRCSNSDQETFDLMAESGCRGVFLGIESGSPAILKNMNKAATVEKYAAGIERLHQSGILTFGSFIIGFPGETDATVKETVDFINATRPTYYRAQMWYNEPGTPIQNEAQKYQITGEGFVWNHLTMDSLAAMDHIDRMFLEIDCSVWLPQWSFDFWIIPYLLGRGISFDEFRDFMTVAHKLLTLEIASIPAQQKMFMQQDYLQSAVKIVRDWNLTF